MDKNLFDRVIKWPDHHELQQIMTEMEHEHRLPQCAGAIDGSFIHMPTPSGTFAEKYWCYKGGEHAILLLAVCDARGKFTYVNVGQPATVGVAAAFARSSLRDSIERLPCLDCSRFFGPHPLSRSFGPHPLSRSSRGILPGLGGVQRTSQLS